MNLNSARFFISFIYVQTTTLLVLVHLNALPHQRILRLFQPQYESRLPRAHASPFAALLAGCGAFTDSLARGVDIQRGNGGVQAVVLGRRLRLRRGVRP
ncbi:hypothetical protein K443DRAFT_431202 [Laccaria amethystina LaAM-08-1]|jgi:hypothetical protein|uniref:Uncharacterized protein n=1 Tax=Laccaria amethystina LaAM-08-1 TaxID=1095629 RepID=A0A0C9Y263_9AGAR|nr:hypothetical protein K443DRAFT_431202 [Laccaria amethystina LaAM-08-1]